MIRPKAIQLMTTLTPEQRQAIEQAGDIPARVVDPETNTVYVLLQADVYERYKALFEPEEDDLDPREMYPFLYKVMKEDWDDPAMDIYDDDASGRTDIASGGIHPKEDP